MKVKKNIIYNDKKEIIDYLKNTVIDASAGTGKTFTICEKVIRRLKIGYKIENFVIITYTEKAAGELVSRIRNRITQELKNNLSEKEKNNLIEALNNFDFATINTIHGFCKSILKEYAFECGLPNNINFDNSNNLYSIAFTESVLADFIKETYFNISNDDIINLFKNNNNNLSEYNLNSAIENYNDKFIIEIPNEIKDFFNNKEIIKSQFEKEYKEDLKRLEKVFEKYDKGTKTYNNPKKNNFIYKYILDVYKIELDSFHNLETHNYNKEQIKFSKDGNDVINKVENEYENQILKIDDLFDKYQYFHYDFNKLFNNINIENYKYIFPYKNKDTYLVNLIKKYILNKKQKEHLVSIINKYHKIKKNNNTFDFSDMIRLVFNALSNNENLIKTLQKKYCVGIIDEFQDTTPMQYYIAKKIFLDRIVDEEINNPSHLIIVGDEKQSIYSFQGANVETYRQAKSEILCPCGITNFKFINYCNGYNGIYQSLDDNYRTNEDLLNLMNNIFSDNHIIENYNNVNSKIKKTSIFPLTIHKYEINENLFNNLNSVKIDYAYKIAKSINDLISEHNKNNNDKLTYNDFCVLFRTVEDATYLAKAFNNEHIKFSHYKKEGLYNSFEAKEILLLLKALAYPSNKTYIKSLFATDFFPDLKLEELNNNENIYIEIENKLEKWRQIFFKQNIYCMFKEIFKDTNVFERLLIDSENYEDTLYNVRSGERNITNLYHISKKLNEFERYNNLVDYINTFNEMIEKSNREDNLEELDTDKDTVKIMTMHSSKGLEFKNVFIFGGWYSFKTKNPCKIVTKTNKEYYYTDSKSDISLKYKKQEIDEFKRLLYVAITRAKEKLFIPYILEKDSTKVNSILSKGIEHIINSPLSNVKIINVTKEEKTQTYSLTKTFTDYKKLNDTIIDNIDYEKLNINSSDKIRKKETFYEFYGNQTRDIKSFSSLRKNDIKKAQDFGLNLEFEYENKEEIIKGEYNSELDDTFLGGKEIGNLIHEILEIIDFQDKSIYKHDGKLKDDWYIGNNKLNKIIEKHKDNIQKITNIISYTLNTNLLPGFKVKDINNCLKEIKFNMVLNNELNENFYLNGAIDLIFEHKNNIYILDWKTNKTKTGNYGQKDIEDLMKEHYNNQYKIYVEAVNKYLAENNCPIKTVSGIFYVFLKPCELEKDAAVYNIKI